MEKRIEPFRMTQFADSHMHGYAPLDESLRHMKELRAEGVTDANLLAYTYIETGIDNNLVCLWIKEKCADVALRVFGGLYYDPDLNNSVMPFREQAQLLLAMGCDGIKFLDMKPNYNLYCGCNMDDAVYDDMYAMLERDGTPLVTHLGDPANFWHRDQVEQYVIDIGWCYDDPKFLTQDQIFDITLKRLDKNPNLNLSIAHFGYMSQRPELAQRVLENYPKVTFDLAPGWEIFVDFAKDIPLWREFFTRYSDRILYGTDTSTTSSRPQIEALHQTMVQFVERGEEEFPIPHNPKANMRGLHLDERARRDICRDNYFRFVGNAVKPLDRALFREHAGTIRAIALKNGDREMVNNVDFMVETI